MLATNSHVVDKAHDWTSRSSWIPSPTSGTTGLRAN